MECVKSKGGPVTDPAATGDEPAQQRILDAAQRLFSERGYENVSVRDIAEEAGVTHPLIYYHWGSKRELLAAVITGTQERMRAAFSGERSTGGDAPALEVRDLLRTLVRDSLADNRAYFLILTRAFLDGMPASDWPGGNPAANASVRMLLETGADGDPAWEEKVRASVAVISALVTGWILLEDQLLDIVRIPLSRREAARELLLDAVDMVIGSAFEARAAHGQRRRRGARLTAAGDKGRSA
jgi:AcrR family transcriptional regulator